MKRQSLLDATAVGLLGAVLAYFNRGLDAGQGFLFGAVCGVVYLLLLHQDVNMLDGRSGRTPFDLANPLRVLRFLLPLALVAVLGLQTALTIGFDVWMDGLTWEPGANFRGVVSSPMLLSAALVGYALATAVLPLRGLLESLPEARSLIKAVPGSVGVALQLADEAKAKPVPVVRAEPAEVIPVLLVTGPRGCGKSTLVQHLRRRDQRFREPEWVATAAAASSGLANAPHIVDEEVFESLQESESLAVSYTPVGDDLEQISLGLPAMSVLAAAVEGGACILDVDPATAKMLLRYNWDRAVAAVHPDKKAELRLVTVWVSLESLDDILERNRSRLEAQGLDPPVVQNQMEPLRKQAPQS